MEAGNGEKLGRYVEVGLALSIRDEDGGGESTDEDDAFRWVVGGGDDG